MLIVRHRFTARGIVALIFSCVSGILGVAVVAWYGVAGQVGEEGRGEKGAGGGVQVLEAKGAPGGEEKDGVLAGRRDDEDVDGVGRRDG